MVRTMLNIAKNLESLSPTFNGELLAAFFKAVGDDLRLNILRLLHHNDYGVMELCQLLDVKQSGMSHHLKVLANAGLVVTPEGGIVIDTLPFPSETRELIDFAERICPAGIKYVINTLSHADHVYGSYLFPEAELIAHELTRDYLATEGERALREDGLTRPTPLESRTGGDTIDDLVGQTGKQGHRT